MFFKYSNHYNKTQIAHCMVGRVDFVSDDFERRISQREKMLSVFVISQQFFRNNNVLIVITINWYKFVKKMSLTLLECYEIGHAHSPKTIKGKEGETTMNKPAIIGKIGLEMVCEDAYEAADFFGEALDAKRVMDDYSEQLVQDYELEKARCMLLYGCIYRFVTPKKNVSMKLRNWYDPKVTPGMHTVTFAAADAEELAEKMRFAGAAAMGEVDAHNSIDGTISKMYRFDATLQTGMRFEFFQAPDLNYVSPEPEESSVVAGNDHLEMLCLDPEAGAQFMENVFGAKRVQHNYTCLIGHNFGFDVTHLEVNDEVYQLITPHPLDKVKPCYWNWFIRDLMPGGIQNVTLWIKDQAAFARKLRESGARTMGEAKGVDYDFQTEIHEYIYDASKQCGVRFEF